VPLLDLIAEAAAEERWLKVGHFLGILFAEGPVFFRITARERTNYKPLSPGTAAADGTIEDWQPKIDDKRVFEPEAKDIILHALWGVKPAPIRVYLDFPSRKPKWNLIGTRKVKGDVGYLDGYESPFDFPSIKSELFCFVDLYPAFYFYNPTSEAEDVYVKLDAMKYKYVIVKNRAMIRDFIEAKRRIRSPCNEFIEPPTCPEWLKDRVGVDTLDYAKRVLELVEEAGIR